MGTDPDFFEALGRSERLNVDLNGEQYSFVMPDMQGGLHDVQTCLSSLAESGTPDQVAAAVAPAAGGPVPAPSDMTSMPAEPVPPVAAAAPVAPPVNRMPSPPIFADAGKTEPLFPPRRNTIAMRRPIPCRP